MKVEELKEQARRHEQREEWQKAFDLYTTALGFEAEDEAPDIALLNRVADIQTRLGQIDGAVGRYEQAIDLYLEAELPNNAIAICKKVLRNLPDRTLFFLKMGQIRAAQGFLTDARQSFLEYAERQTALGDVESALNALIEFVELSPEDVEIRQSLASQLESHDRGEEAIHHYREVHRQLVLLGRDDEAGETFEKLRELDSDSSLPDSESILAGEKPDHPEDLVVEATSLGGLGEGDWGEISERDAVGIESTEPPVIEEPDQVEVQGDEGGLGIEEGDMDELPTFDFGGEELVEEVEVITSFSSEEIERDASEREGVDQDSAGAGDLLPLINFEDEEDDEHEGDDDEVDRDTLAVLGVEELAEGPENKEPEEVEAATVAQEGLPFLFLDDESEETSPGPAVEGPLEEAAFEEDRSAPAEAEPELPEVPAETALEDFHEAADRGDMDLALDRVKAHILAKPDDIQLHQRLVEYAFRKNDQPTLVSAYLELARCLARTGAPGKARAVYQQVLTLSPGHEGATVGLRELDGTVPPAPVTQVASSEEYVDLGSMILGEGDKESTRWTVRAEAPSGDEEADFAKMLRQFKEKVSEHLAADDVGAHHDLGTAYMEMGLLDEAIAEFQMALRASPDHLPTHEVMGRCWMEMGKPDMAIRALARALTVDYQIEDEMIGIYYLMGRAQEAEGNTSEALEFYDKVFSLDINFEDVTDRLRSLR